MHAACSAGPRCGRTHTHTRSTEHTRSYTMHAYRVRLAGDALLLPCSVTAACTHACERARGYYDRKLCNPNKGFHKRQNPPHCHPAAAPASSPTARSDRPNDPTRHRSRTTHSHAATVSVQWRARVLRFTTTYTIEATIEATGIS